MKSIVSIFAFIFISSVAIVQAQEKKTISLEAGVDWASKGASSTSGLKYYSKISYPIFSRIGVSGSIGHYNSLVSPSESLLSKELNSKMFLFDADVDFYLVKTKSYKALILSFGATYLSANNHWSSSYYGSDAVYYDGASFDEVVYNLKLSYRFPISGHIFSAINAEAYNAGFESKRNQLFGIGYSVGYRF